MSEKCDCSSQEKRRPATGHSNTENDDVRAKFSNRIIASKTFCHYYSNCRRTENMNDNRSLIDRFVSGKYYIEVDLNLDLKTPLGRMTTTITPNVGNHTNYLVVVIIHLIYQKNRQQFCFQSVLRKWYNHGI